MEFAIGGVAGAELTGVDETRQIAALLGEPQAFCCRQRVVNVP
jgi:hypothetical protein